MDVAAASDTADELSAAGSAFDDDNTSPTTPRGVDASSVRATLLVGVIMGLDALTEIGAFFISIDSLPMTLRRNEVLQTCQRLLRLLLDAVLNGQRSLLRRRRQHRRRLLHACLLTNPVQRAKDILLQRHQVLVVRDHEHVVVEVDDVPAGLLRHDVQLLTLHHDVVFHTVKRVGEQFRETAQQRHEAQLDLAQLGDGVDGADEQTVHVAVAQKEDARLNEMSEQLPGLGVSNGIGSYLFSYQFLLLGRKVQSGDQFANPHVGEIEEIADEQLDGHRDSLPMRPLSDCDVLILHSNVLPNVAVLRPDRVVHDVLVDLLSTQEDTSHPREMHPHVSGDEIVRLLIQLLDELLENP